MKLEYRLLPKEMEESLQCFNWKREGVLKQINVVLISLITVYCLVGYVRDTKKFFLFVLALCCVILMFALLYLPPFLRSKKAKKMNPVGSTFRIEIPEKGINKAFESENVITLQKEGYIYCIPKRVIEKEELKKIKEAIQTSGCNFLQIKTGRDKADE
ncbi:MAG: hypothetical protein RR869_06290 [Lachnospiraceae bacterium]